MEPINPEPLNLEGVSSLNIQKERQQAPGSNNLLRSKPFFLTSKVVQGYLMSVS
jgi:hypothetical protein